MTLPGLLLHQNKKKIKCISFLDLHIWEKKIQLEWEGEVDKGREKKKSGNKITITEYNRNDHRDFKCILTNPEVSQIHWLPLSEPYSFYWPERISIHLIKI